MKQEHQEPWVVVARIEQNIHGHQSIPHKVKKTMNREERNIINVQGTDPGAWKRCYVELWYSEKEEEKQL